MVAFIHAKASPMCRCAECQRKAELLACAEQLQVECYELSQLVQKQKLALVRQEQAALNSASDADYWRSLYESTAGESLWLTAAASTACTVTGYCLRLWLERGGL